MEYVVGSVAALISGGNVTPNRPRLVKRALTPKKHQASPNVTPRSESLDDRSIFLSPSLQRKKAMVKKSPKRIFENPDLDLTNDGEGISTLTSPKADKVKKHLEDELEASPIGNLSLKSLKSTMGKHNKSITPGSPSKKLKIVCEEDNSGVDAQASNENTPKKKKKQRNSIVEASGTFEVEEKENLQSEELVSVVNIETNSGTSPKKKKGKKLISELTENMEFTEEIDENQEEPDITVNKVTSKKNLKKKHNKSKSQNPDSIQKLSPSKHNQCNNKSTEPQSNQQKSKKKNKRKKKTELQNQDNEPTLINQESKQSTDDTQTNLSKKIKKKLIVNPNAITNKDSDSEHDSDDEIESETEEANKEIFDTGPFEESSDEESREVKKPEKKEETERHSEEEVKRTLFVGNVPFSNKIKKEIKKIFTKYGDIETIRIRTVPVKDARYTPKLAIIKNELHPERTAVNVYVKYTDASSVDKALVANNTVLNGYHLRVTRSDSSGAEHDPACAVFVGNLPFGMEDEKFRELFEACGDIDSVRIVRDRKTNAGKGFGYVNFTSKDGVELALAMTEEDLTVKNKILRVQRCTLNPRKQSKKLKSSNEGRHEGYQGRNQGGSRGGYHGDDQGISRGGFRGRNRGGFRGRSQGDFQRNQGFQGRNQGFEGRNQEEVQGGSRGGFRGRTRGGFRGRSQGFQGRSQGFQSRSQGFKEGGAFGGMESGQQFNNGAERRVMNKRKSQDGGGEGPPNKRTNNAEPSREKKERKEFVGLTAEKKKKHKVDKGQKKKKALSEILTK